MKLLCLLPKMLDIWDPTHQRNDTSYKNRNQTHQRNDSAHKNKSTWSSRYFKIFLCDIKFEHTKFEHTTYEHTKFEQKNQKELV